MEYGCAYNARSTRPIYHWFKQPDLVGAKPVIKALCGAQVPWHLADGNTGHLHGCSKCHEKWLKLTSK